VLTQGSLLAESVWAAAFGCHQSFQSLVLTQGCVSAFLGRVLCPFFVFVCKNAVIMPAWHTVLNPMHAMISTPEYAYGFHYQLSSLSSDPYQAQVVAWFVLLGSMKPQLEAAFCLLR
jgi:hypothetical protein